jgi:hypothetical protein
MLEGGQEVFIQLDFIGTIVCFFFVLIGRRSFTSLG